MELHGRQIFDILAKPLSLATKFLFSLSEGKPLKPSGSSLDGHYSPSPATHSPITSNPLIPAFIVLLVGFLLLSQSPIRVWLAETEDLPTLAKIFSFSHKASASSLPRAGENISVWAKKQSGFYYCQDGTLFGDKPGKMITQSDALTSGYRPAGGTYCTSSQPVVASANATESPALVAANQPGTAVSREDVKVWALKQLGFYYCRGDTLFGVRPGHLMTQANAVAAGLIPSYHTCSGSRAIIASAGALSSGTEPSSGLSSTPPYSMEPSAVISEKPANTSTADARVNVWVKKKFGFYYCCNDVLFGNKPGQLMSQAAALSEGYQPSDGRCTSSTQNRATAERFSPRTFPGTK